MRKKLASVFLAVVFVLTAVFSPAVNVSAAYRPPEELNSKAAFMINLDSDTVVFTKNEEDRMYPASLTKIMTAIIVLEEETDFERVITAPRYIYDEFAGIGVSTADFRAGEELRIIDILYGLLLQSACEGASILADYYGGGSIPAFIDKMNDKAAEIGAKNTHFVNPHGLHDPDQYTTAKDVYLITKYALSLDKFEEIACTPVYEAPATNVHAARYLVHTNNMMNQMRGGPYYYEPIRGIKTGTTDESGKNLVSLATKDGFTYLLVTMGAPMYNDDGSRIDDNLCFRDTKMLYEWAFDTFGFKTVLKTTETVSTVPVRLSSETDTLQLGPKEDLTLLFPNDIDLSSVQRVLHLPESVDAPVAKGDVIGTVELKLNDEVIGESELVSTSDVSKNFIYGVWDWIVKIMGSIWAKIILGVIAFLILFYIVVTILYNRKKKRRRKLTLQRAKQKRRRR